MFNDGPLPNNNAVVLPSGDLLITDLKYTDHLENYRCVAKNPVTMEEWYSPTTTLARASPSKFILVTEHTCLIIKCRAYYSSA